jgi:hypothetical protein
VGSQREVLILEPIADHSEVRRWLSAMEDAMRDTLRELEGVTDDMVDRRVVDELNTIGTLLYHIALVEADWLLDDILGERSDWPTDLLPYGDRDPKGVLTEVSGFSLSVHVERLAAVRELLLTRLRPMSTEDFHGPRPGAVRRVAELGPPPPVAAQGRAPGARRLGQGPPATLTGARSPRSRSP